MMKKLIAILTALCLLFGVCSAAVSALSFGGCFTGSTVYFVDNGVLEDFYIYYWYQGYGENEWPGVKMTKYGVNADGDDVYSFDLPDQVDYFIVDDDQGNQTCDIPYTGASVLVTMTDEKNEYGHYLVNTLAVDGLDPLDPTKPIVPAIQGGNLIELENTLPNLSDVPFGDPICICCRSDEEEEATLCAQMEPFAQDPFGITTYRFTVPVGMKYFYFTDGKKKTIEMPVTGFMRMSFTGDIGEDGLYEIFSVGWSAGGSDPAYSPGASRTLFDRFAAAFAYSKEKYPRYEELYTHDDSSGNADWVLIYAQPDDNPDGDFRNLIGNRFVEHWTTYDAPIPSWYCVYDVKKDTFVPVDSDMVDQYEGLARAFDEVGKGRLLGDVDGDDSISVIDATCIQRCEAKMRDYPEDDEVYDDYLTVLMNIRYFSDFNRDGGRDILDATCIQRYLVNLPYPIG